MKRVLVLVEGQTEETFIRDVLRPHLQQRSIYPIPTLLQTKRVKSGPSFKGGVGSYAKVHADVRSLLHDTNAVVVTTMLDYYGLPQDFPGLSTRPLATPLDRVSHVEQAFRAAIADRRFLPYLSLHEFEALVFVDPIRCAFVFDGKREVVDELHAIRQNAAPEDINEGPETAPSKRLKKAFPGYQKTFHGPLATTEMGISDLRAACPHFNNWVTRLETI